MTWFDILKFDDEIRYDLNDDLFIGVGNMGNLDAGNIRDDICCVEARKKYVDIFKAIKVEEVGTLPALMTASCEELRQIKCDRDGHLHFTHNDRDYKQKIGSKDRLSIRWVNEAWNRCEEKFV